MGEQATTNQNEAFVTSSKVLSWVTGASMVLFTAISSFLITTIQESQKEQTDIKVSLARIEEKLSDIDKLKEDMSYYRDKIQIHDRLIEMLLDKSDANISNIKKDIERLQQRSK
jgi:peptidoglycan hydrolase CwlO-like protein